MSAWVLAIIAGLTIGVVYLMETSVPKWLEALGSGIAQAEGFGIPGAIPTTHNNPGDITDSGGSKLTFASAQEGFRALYDNVMGAFTGTSIYYSPSMTLESFAAVWTGEDQAAAWLETVLSVFNATVGSSLTADNTLADMQAATGGE